MAATTVLNGVKSPNGKRAYTLTVEVVSRTATQVQLKIDFSVKFVAAKTSGNYVEVDLTIKGISSDELIWWELGKTDFSKGTVKSTTLYETISAKGSGGYYLDLGKIIVDYGYGTKSVIEYNEDYGYAKNPGVSIYVPSYVTPVDPTPTPTPTPTYNVSLTGTGGQGSVTATANGLPSSCNIRWYLDGVLRKTTTKTSGSSASETFTGLIPSTVYQLRVVVDSGGTTVGTASATATTQAESGTLALETTSRAIIARLTGMSSSPNYSRTVVFSLYSAETGETKNYTYTGITATGVSHTFEGLDINTKYTVTATIKNSGLTLRTISGTATTGNDYNLLPTATIVGIKQVKGTTDALVSWITDKKASGTTYTFEIKREGAEWTEAIERRATSSPVIVPVTLAHGSTGEDISLRIKASNEYLAGESYTTSNESTFHITGEFDWDVPKEVGGALIITASEWNRLGNFVRAKAASYDLSPEITTVVSGMKISAELYNEMKNAINSMVGLNITDKEPGNPIRAADINALRMGINMA